MALKNPDAIAVIVTALRLTHGDEAARAMLVGGMSLAALIDAMFSAPVGRRDAVHNITSALDDFAISPELGPAWHLRYLYEITARFASSTWRLRRQPARCPVKTSGFVCPSSYLGTSAMSPVGFNTSELR
ncbi:hypothetical protein [Bradyrhizobium sp. 35]|uniref:hypothetical protein n=1 Tax=Bradyrhizobium sp. 35 TaxID=2782670 RepID=UPI003211AA89